MTDHAQPSPKWVPKLCEIAAVWREPGQRSIRGLFQEARPDLSDRVTFVRNVRAELDRRPELVDAWLGFVEDQRGTPAPYFQETGEVGIVQPDGKASGSFVHADLRDACADYLFRESMSVLRGEQVLDSGSDAQPA